MSAMTALAETSLWLLVLLPAVTGTLLVLTPRADRVAGAVATVTATLVVALSLVVAVHRPQVGVPFVAGADFGMRVDGLAALVLPAVTVVTLMVLVVAAAEVDESPARFHGLMLVFAAAAALTVTATTLPTLLFAWELMGATSYALVGFRWREQERVSAGLTAFLTTRTADLGMYLAAAAALAGGAGLALADLPDSSGGWRQVIAAGLLVAALGKAAQLPFSFWLSGAMLGPSPVSALLHSAAMVAMGGYLLLRVEPLLSATGWAGPVTAWVGAATALLLGAVALAQRDLKQLLAASTCAQLGFVVLAAGVSAVSGGAAHLVAHAATKALLFLAAGAWLTALGTRQLAGLQGVARRWRVVGWSATVGALALAGIAPLSLWATKDAVLAAALQQSPGLYAVGLAASVLSAGYAAKILVTIWRPVPAGGLRSVEEHVDQEEQGTRRIGAQEQAPMVVLAIGAAGLGVLALGPVAGAVTRSLGTDAPYVAVWELVVSAVLALAAVVFVARRGVPEPGWARTWLGLEATAQNLLVRPTLRVAGSLARFDDRVLDGGVDLVTTASLRAAERTARGDNRRVDGLVEWLATGLRALGEQARRLQTGQLHHYYVQAVVVLAAGIALLVTVR